MSMIKIVEGIFSSDEIALIVNYKLSVSKKNKLWNEIPERQGYDVVWKDYDPRGKGFYYAHKKPKLP